MADRKTLQAETDLGPLRLPRPAWNAARSRSLQADRHHHLHRLQGLRSGLRRVERHALSADHLRQYLPDDARRRAGISGTSSSSTKHQHPDGTIQWLMRKDQCMHCADPGCLRACPADGAIVQYANGIVDFQQENCIGCEFCVSGCPFNIPQVQSRDRRRFTSARCAPTASARGSNPPASRLVRRAA